MTHATSAGRPGRPDHPVADGRDRTPRSLVALACAGALATIAMALAPQVGALDPRTGHDDAIVPGTDGTAHYESPETDRRVDVQLVSVTRPADLPPGVSAPSGTEVVAVDLRLAAARGEHIAGCRVELWADGEPVPVTRVTGAAPCGGRASGPAAVEGRSVVLLAVPVGARPTHVRVMWQPPTYVSLPVV